MSIPVRRGDGVAGGVGLVGGASPRGDRASALDRVKTLKTRLLIASVLQAASAILVGRARGLSARLPFYRL